MVFTFSINCVFLCLFPAIPSYLCLVSFCSQTTANLDDHFSVFSDPYLRKINHTCPCKISVTDRPKHVVSMSFVHISVSLTRDIFSFTFCVREDLVLIQLFILPPLT